jgi:hypothetical protein
VIDDEIMMSTVTDETMEGEMAVVISDSQKKEENKNEVEDLESGEETKTTTAVEENKAQQQGRKEQKKKSTREILKDRKNRPCGSMYREVVLPREVDSALTIPNMCAICLESYQEGTTVVWSGNPSCQHAFHQDCILDYLVQHKKDAAPCPCCRQVFLPKQRWKPKTPFVSTTQ